MSDGPEGPGQRPELLPHPGVLRGGAGPAPAVRGPGRGPAPAGYSGTVK